MKTEEIQLLFEEYEQAACDVNKVECWSARDLQRETAISKERIDNNSWWGEGEVISVFNYYSVIQLFSC